MNPEFISVLSGFGEKAFVVLHDRDMNSDGTPKKSHYHVLVMCENRRSENSIRKLVNACGGANNSYQGVMSKRSYARYLCHLDNLDKMPYEPEEVQCLCGADYMKVALTNADREKGRHKKLREILRYCRENKVFYYCDLVDKCLDERQDWFPLLTGSSGRVIRNYILSLEYADGKRS